jgi:uncharacterized OB-fold protein
LRLSICRSCGATYFPARLACARCGHRSFRTDEATSGVVEECVRIHRSRGGVAHIATVRAGDIRFVAGLARAVRTGERVLLDERDGAPFATPASPAAPAAEPPGRVV